VPNKRIYRTGETLRTTGSVLDKKNIRRRVLIEEKLEDIGTQMETIPRTFLDWLAAQGRVLNSLSPLGTNAFKTMPI
jgi:hypothetical protein